MNLGNIKNIFGRDPVQGPQPKPAAKPAADKKVNAPAAKAVEVANVSLGNDVRPSKALRAWTFTKANSPRIAYGAAIIAAVAMVALSGGFASPLAIAGYALGGAAILGAGIYETSRKRKIDKLAKEFHKAIIAFDRAETDNQVASARVRLQNAHGKLLTFVKNNAGSVEDLRTISKRIASANRNKNYRIANNEIFGEINPKGRVTSEPDASTFDALVDAVIIARVEDGAQRVYRNAIKSKAKEIASLLKGNIGEAKKARFKLYEVAREIHGNNTYKLAGRKFNDVMRDLAGAIQESLGGEKAIKKDLAKLEDLMKNNVKFYNEIASKKSEISKDFYKEYKKLDAEIKALKREESKLIKELAVLGKENTSLVNIINKDQKTLERLEEVSKQLVENKNKQDELNSKKEQLAISKKAKEEELKVRVAKLAEDLAININAKRQLLSQILGEKNQRAPLAMPNIPDWKDKGKFYGKRAVAVGVAGVGLYYGRIPAAVAFKAARPWAGALRRVVSGRAMPYVAPVGGAALRYASRAGSVASSAITEIGGYFRSFANEVVSVRG